MYAHSYCNITFVWTRKYVKYKTNKMDTPLSLVIVFFFRKLISVLV